MKVAVEPIRTKEDYARTLAELESLRGAPIGTLDGDRYDVLLDLAHAFYRKTTPNRESENPSAQTAVAEGQGPVDAIKRAMSDRNVKPIQLGEILGTTSRAYEVLNGKRGLSIAMIRALHKEFGIPFETLIGE